MESMTPEQKSLLENYIHAEQIDKASTLVAQLAADHARAKQFDLAEALRDRLYEIDCMALDTIIKVNEIIEREKSSVIKPAQKKLWSSFFENLTPEEVTDFVLALTPLEIGSDQTIIAQGQANDRLYLLNQGQIKIFHNGFSKKFLIKKLGPGDFFGEDEFFSLNVTTSSAASLSAVILMYLGKEKLEILKRKHPCIEENLKKACTGGPSTFELLRTMGKDRRAFKRIHLNVKVMFQVVSSETQETESESVTAELWNISKQGLCFYLNCKKAQDVQRLIGKSLRMRFSLVVKGKKRAVALTGTVVGVQSHPFDEFSVHLKLPGLLSDAAMALIQR